VGVRFDDLDRLSRQYSILKEDDRSPPERDCDRILYSSAFRRLSGVTQVVRAGEADVFHTRQQHTLKVAQIGKRISQRLKKISAEPYVYLGIDENVVEAACLAHDLGHPPFGHIGEKVLDAFAIDSGNDGYEGNAQSFRIVNKLAVRLSNKPGLDLTRATLSALIKYPWLRNMQDPDKKQKWNAYKCDEKDFDFATSLYGKVKTIEAEIMDWADDLAYSVHDLEDLHRCRIVPWKSLLEGGLSGRLVSEALKRWHGAPTGAEGRLREAQRSLAEFLLGSFGGFLSEPYDASREQRAELRRMTSALIGQYVRAFSLKPIGEPQTDRQCFNIDRNHVDQVRILKQINYECMINSPSLVAQQYGQQEIIKSLCDKIYNSSDVSYPRFLPTRLRYLWDLSEGDKSRFTTDCVSALTEQEAVGLNARLCGLASGSVLDPIVR